jgi:hypothetical protein
MEALMTLLTLWKRYREADDYNRPAVKLLLRTVLRSVTQ